MDDSTAEPKSQNRSAVMKYGLFTGVIFGFAQWLPQPGGAIVFWSALALQAAAGGWIIWRRLRLPWLTLASVIALAGCIAMAVISGRGLNLITMVAVLPISVVSAIWLGIIAVPLCVGLESQRNSKEWQTWATHMAHASVTDMLMFRHVPNLRGS